MVPDSYRSPLRHRIENKQMGTRFGTFDVCVAKYVTLRMFIVQVLASQLHFLASRNIGLPILPLFWPVNCLKVGGHVALLSDPTVYSLYCAYKVFHCCRDVGILPQEMLRGMIRISKHFTN